MNNANARREKCPYSEFCWSLFSRIWAVCRDLPCKSLYSVVMRENTGQKNSEDGHHIRSEVSYLEISDQLVFCSYYKKCLNGLFITN